MFKFRTFLLFVVLCYFNLLLYSQSFICPNCSGYGQFANGVICTVCKGNGAVIPCIRCSGYGYFANGATCLSCSGFGVLPVRMSNTQDSYQRSSTICGRCKGRGFYKSPNVATFGQINYAKCINCGDTYIVGSGHSCRCNRCGGSGRIKK